MTETNQEESGFNPISAKEQQKRASIMNELYNDISSSDDEDEDSSTTNSDKMASVAASNSSSKPQSATAQSTTNADGDGSAGAAGDLANPFKRQVSAAASEALKELYGEDSEDSGDDDLLSFEVAGNGDQP